MNLYVFNTQNRHNQYLIFTSKKALLNWGRQATRLKDIEILAQSQKLTKICDHYNFFGVSNNDNITNNNINF